MGREKCDHCDWNESIGFNYCRKCGYHLNAGKIHTRIVRAKERTDKFCGNCGQEVNKCKCSLPPR